MCRISPRAAKVLAGLVEQKSFLSAIAVPKTGFGRIDIRLNEIFVMFTIVTCLLRYTSNFAEFRATCLMFL